MISPENTKTSDFNPQRTLSGSFFVISERLGSIHAIVLAFTAKKETLSNIETKEENCRLDYPALSCNDVSAWTSTVVARERRLGPRRAQQAVRPFMGPDDALSPLRWMSTHLHRCRTTQGSLADSFLLLSQYSQPCTNPLSSVYERTTI